jgi:hypothetical protein
MTDKDRPELSSKRAPHKDKRASVRFEVSTTVTMKNGVF